MAALYAVRDMEVNPVFKLQIIVKAVITYLLSGAALITFHSASGIDGHAHVPFSSFPSNLIMSPFAPAFLIDGSLKYYLVYFGAALLITLAFVFHHKLGGKRGV